MWKKRHRARKEEVARAMGEDVPSSADEAELDDETLLAANGKPAAAATGITMPGVSSVGYASDELQADPVSSELRIYRRRIYGGSEARV